MKNKRDMTGADQEPGRCGDAWDCEPKPQHMPPPEAELRALKGFWTLHNAAFIVRAVNAHDSLLGNLKRALVTEEMKGVGFMGLWVADARNAIAKAEGR